MTQASIKNFLSRNTLVIEVALLLVALLGILLFFYDFPHANLCLLISLTLAAIFYFMVASVEIKNGNAIAFYAYKATNIGCSLIILGTMFRLLQYPGHELMLKTGVISMSIALLVYLYQSRNHWSGNLIALVVRISLIATLGLVMWLL